MAKRENISQDMKIGIKNVLENSYLQMKEVFNLGLQPQLKLSKRLIKHLDIITDKSESASAAFTNIITGLAIKINNAELDVRFHQTQIQHESSLGIVWFNHRGISEKIVYPWLSDNNFAGAKSGWQTRTLERPKPYTRNYDENIKDVKIPFLEIYESTAEESQEVIKAQLDYLLFRQIEIRENRVIDLATPNIDIISTIIGHFKSHLNYKYEGKGASRLPVLAIYATLTLVSEEIARYRNVELKTLESHSAADSQTGAAGDIEFADNEGNIFEALEIKHGVLVDKNIVQDTAGKISKFQLQRYYILTTAENCTPDEEINNLLDKVQQKIGCQIIVNGVFPTMQYYLRLVSTPSKVYKKYTELLIEDSAATHEHREIWNKIILRD